MGRLFGTDGVRGIAGKDMTCELAMEIGRAAATVLTYGRRRRPLVVLGKDTRLSSDMLGAALAAGLCSVGADVIDLGVISTPAVAYLVGKYKAARASSCPTSWKTRSRLWCWTKRGRFLWCPGAIWARSPTAPRRCGIISST